MSVETTILIDIFKTKAEAVGSEVYHFPGKNEALTFILYLLKKESIAEADGCIAVWADGPFLNGIPRDRLLEKVPGLRFDVTSETAAAAKIGISQMDLAIADTGTLIQDATAVEQRLVSTLPEIHIALMSTQKIVPDLATALTKINPNDADYLTFITGPSRTADIERVLTIGVHGPERLVIILVDRLEE
jgi:L-lactate dehydrogenase complex protein LldG